MLTVVLVSFSGSHGKPSISDKTDAHNVVWNKPELLPDTLTFGSGGSGSFEKIIFPKTLPRSSAQNECIGLWVKDDEQKQEKHWGRYSLERQAKQKMAILPNRGSLLKEGLSVKLKNAMQKLEDHNSLIKNGDDPWKRGRPRFLSHAENDDGKKMNRGRYKSAHARTPGTDTFNKRRRFLSSKTGKRFTKWSSVGSSGEGEAKFLGQSKVLGSFYYKKTDKTNWPPNVKLNSKSNSATSDGENLRNWGRVKSALSKSENSVSESKGSRDGESFDNRIFPLYDGAHETKRRYPKIDTNLVEYDNK